MNPKNQGSKRFEIFEKKLPSFGEYIEKEVFNQRIPENVYQFMVQNEFKLPNNFNINKNVYQMKPVKFKNDNIYEELGMKIIRFTNDEIIGNIEMVINKIKEEIAPLPPAGE